MLIRRRKQFLRRLIEEGDRVFRADWEQSEKNKRGKSLPSTLQIPACGFSASSSPEGYAPKPS
jgi:hypothetical protein